MKKILLFLWVLPSCISCQDFGRLELVADLPGLLKEVSGIEYSTESNLIWSINDSRNAPEVYGFDIESQKIQRTIRLKGASNIDWEDLAFSEDGTLYVGDFGNNISNRTDLAIYHVPTPDSGEKRRQEPLITTFAYQDQINFPPKEKDKSYDVEAFIHLNESFYLFTRNRSKKYDGTTKIYKITAEEGPQEAIYVGELETCKDQSDCEITSAAIHHPTGKIALLSYNKVWIISDYQNDYFPSGKVEKIKLGHSSQKESISFKTENELYIADERTHGKGRNLYLLRLD